jgi:hypothetical protein
MKQQSFNELKSNLSPQDIDAIVEIVGHRCQQKTKVRLRSILTYGTSSVGSFGIFSRLIKFDYGWEYVAGQYYPDEIRTVRELILGKRY